jgi:hypothetical protein
MAPNPAVNRSLPAALFILGALRRIWRAGLPEVIPFEMCYLGWQESLAQLATLVEPEIPG